VEAENWRESGEGIEVTNQEKATARGKATARANATAKRERCKEMGAVREGQPAVEGAPCKERMMSSGEIGGRNGLRDPIRAFCQLDASFLNSSQPSRPAMLRPRRRITTEYPG
jgi:hypothetical protein